MLPQYIHFYKFGDSNPVYSQEVYLDDYFTLYGGSIFDRVEYDYVIIGNGIYLRGDIEEQSTYIAQETTQLTVSYIKFGRYNKMILDLLSKGESDKDIVISVMKESKGHENPETIKERIGLLKELFNLG